MPSSLSLPRARFGRSQVPAVDSDDAEQRDEFVEAFRADGRVSHMTLVMGMHPRYLARFREAHNRMLWDEGPLDLPYRHMIAILVGIRSLTHPLTHSPDSLTHSFDLPYRHMIPILVRERGVREKEKERQSGRHMIAIPVSSKP